MNERVRVRVRQIAPHAITIIIVALILVADRVWAAPALSTTPGVITYQGYLTDAGGATVNGDVDFTFSLFSAPTGGSALWTETHTTVPVTNGLFNVLLGSNVGIPATVWTNNSLYLELQVGGDNPMTPRELVSSVPYALYAMHSDRAYGLSAADGSPDTAVIVDNDGNVGIGANTPAARLHLQTQNANTRALIEAQGDYNATLDLTSNSKTWQWSKRASNSDDELWLRFSDGINWFDFIKISTTGDINFTANRLQIGGAKPILFRRYQGLSGDALIEDFIQKADGTNVHYLNYVCAVAGFKIDGDIQEIGLQYPLLRVEVSVSSSGYWKFYLQMADKVGDLQGWQLDVMCVDSRMANMVGYATP